MAAITIDLPDHLARYAAEQVLKNPGWLETVVRSALEKLAPRTAEPTPAPAGAPPPAGPEPTAAEARAAPARRTGDWPDAWADWQNATTPEARAALQARWQEAIDKACGFCANDPGTVDEFLADCRADKERELARERRRQEESDRYAAAPA